MLIKRNKSKKIKVGCIQIGNSNNIIIQSMTNTKTSNIDSTLKQIIELKKNGCDLVRVSVLDQEDCNALKIIIKQAPCPIIADIHYNHQFAIDAIKANVAKIRINPANIANEENLHQIVSMAKKYKVAIRIGLNKGSYDKISNNELINQAILYIKKFESWKFNQIVVSVKSSNIEETIELNKILASKTKYPIHLGVSEAGLPTDAIIKSSIGLYPLLKMGVGSTIRISISGSPINEPIIAKKIMSLANLYHKHVNLIVCPTCGRLQWDIQSFIKKIEPVINNLERKISIAIMGCAVNGIGECKNADFGIYGNKTHGFIYKHQKLLKQVEHKNLFKEFEKLFLR